MTRWFRTILAVAVVALLPVFFTSTAFADDPTPKPTLHYVEAPLDRPPGTTAAEVTKSPAPTETATTPAPQSSETTPAPPESVPDTPTELAKTGGQRDIWLTGCSLLCIWTGAAVITYARERSLKR